VLEGSPKQIEQYHNGQTKLLGYFVGQVMKATQGKANPQQVNELLRKRLDG
jgi:aspartyl-tRNA(Asn)/glutamyl-tRNA(Gln) amidotransferase subunit B